MDREGASLCRTVGGSPPDRPARLTCKPERQCESPGCDTAERQSTSPIQGTRTTVCGYIIPPSGPDAKERSTLGNTGEENYVPMQKNSGSSDGAIETWKPAGSNSPSGFAANLTMRQVGVPEGRPEFHGGHATAQKEQTQGTECMYPVTSASRIPADDPDHHAGLAAPSGTETAHAAAPGALRPCLKGQRRAMSRERLHLLRQEHAIRMSWRRSRLQHLHALLRIEKTREEIAQCSQRELERAIDEIEGGECERQDVKPLELGED